MNLELKGLKLLSSIDKSVSNSHTSSTDTMNYLAVELLVPGSYQPRKLFDDANLNELADSIKAQGVIQPLIVRRIADKFEIIAGERRWRAAKIAGLICVPAIIRNIDDTTALAFSLIENIQRENLNPIEEAVAFSRLREEFKITHEQLAGMLGRSRTSITNSLRLLTLQPRVRCMLEERKIDMGHARALLTLESERQYQVACLIVEKQLNVREAEELANKLKVQGEEKTTPSQKYHEQCKNWSHQLSEKFTTNVVVKVNNQGKGKVVIEVNSTDEIDWLVKFISNQHK